jgi:hypothetical protein
MPFDATPPAKPAFDMDAYMERFCARLDLVSNHPKGISHLSPEQQLAACLAESERGLDRFPGFRKGGV